MNYFSLTTADDGSEFIFDGNSMDIIRNLGQVVADSPLGANILIGIIAQALYCQGTISEGMFDEVLTSIDNELDKFETIVDVWFDEE